MNATVPAIALVLLSAGLAGAEETSNRTPKRAQAFWEQPTTTIVRSALTPADIRLLAGPDLTKQLQTFASSNMTAPADFIPANESPVAHFVRNEQDYGVSPAGLVHDARPFVDRDYKITELPARFSRLTLLQTKMGHKGIVDARFAILLSVARPVYLFLAIDERALTTFEEHGAPGWMQDFAPTGERIFTDDPIMGATHSGFLVFVKRIPAGRVSLGPGCADPVRNSMYFAFFAAATESDQTNIPQNAIQGIWSLQSDDEDDRTRLKFIVDGTWTITQRDASTGKVIYHHGGSYAFDGLTYREKVEFANANTAHLIGAEHTFALTVQGDLLHQEGIGNPWTEDWTRVKDGTARGNLP